MGYKKPRNSRRNWTVVKPDLECFEQGGWPGNCDAMTLLKTNDGGPDQQKHSEHEVGILSPPKLLLLTIDAFVRRRCQLLDTFTWSFRVLVLLFWAYCIHQVVGLVHQLRPAGLLTLWRIPNDIMVALSREASRLMDLSSILTCDARFKRSLSLSILRPLLYQQIQRGVHRWTCRAPH